MENKLYGTVLLKAKQILDLIADSAEAPTLNELSQQLAISKPTIFKILKTLEYCGYVRSVTVGEKKSYRLGTIFLRYADTVNNSMNIVEIASPWLKKLRDQTAETVNLGVDEDHSVVLLAKMESTHSIKLVSVIGGKMHMYSSAMGKAMLATYPAAELDQYLAATRYQQMTSNTITDRQRLRDEIAVVRQQGYAIDNVENQPGVYCIGFSLTANHQLYGAFSISTPEFRMDEQKKEEFIRWGQETKAAIEAQL